MKNKYPFFIPYQSPFYRGAMILFTAFIFLLPLFIYSEDQSPITVIVPVDNRSQSALQQSLQAAFAEAMMETSNDLQIMNAPGIQQAQSAASSFVQSYSYIEGNNGGLSLQVLFDPQSLRTLLQKTKLSTDNKMASRTTVLVSVLGVGSFGEYSALMKSLHERQEISRISVKNMDGNGVLLSLTANANKNDLQTLLSQNPHLLLQPTQGHPQPSADLYYLWQS